MKTSRLHLLPIVFVTMLFSCSGGNNDLDKSGLKGKVSGYTEYWFEAKHDDGKWVAGAPVYFGNRIMKFNQEGNYVGSTILTEKGDPVGFIECRWEDGELKEEVFHSNSDSRTSKTMYEKISDTEIHFEIRDGDRLIFEGATFLDSRGRIVRQAQVVNDSEVNNYYVYKKDLMIKFYQEDLTGVRTITHLYEYEDVDKKGNWTARLVYPEDEKIVPKFYVTREYTYY